MGQTPLPPPPPRARVEQPWYWSGPCSSTCSTCRVSLGLLLPAQPYAAAGVAGALHGRRDEGSAAMHKPLATMRIELLALAPAAAQRGQQAGRQVPRCVGANN